jgi:hypothetical protein
MQGHISPDLSGFKAASPCKRYNFLKTHIIQYGTSVAIKIDICVTEKRAVLHSVEENDID